MHLAPWILQTPAKCSHFQQFLHYNTPGFIFAPWTVAMKLPILNHLLMRLLVLEPLWEFYILIQIMDMSDLGDTLIILGFETRMILLNIWLLLKILLMLSDEMHMLEALARKGTPIIFKYDFDWDSLRDWTYSDLTQTMLLTYCSIAWRSNRLVILLVVMMISLLSMWIKLAMLLDLIFLRILLMFMMWVLESLIKPVALLLLIGTITCLHNGFLVVIFSLGLGLPYPLIIFWTISIFLFWSLGKASLIFSVSLVILEVLVGLAETCT